MSIRAVGSALSGVQSAFERRNVAAHNVANLQTEDFRPLRARQVEASPSGSRVEVEQSAEPREVDLASELVGASVASTQARASLRVLDTELDLVGSLIDTLG